MLCIVLSLFVSFHYLVNIQLVTLCCHYLIMFIIWSVLCHSLIQKHYLILFIMLSLFGSLHYIVKNDSLHDFDIIRFFSIWSLFVIIWLFSLTGNFQLVALCCHYLTFFITWSLFYDFHYLVSILSLSCHYLIMCIIWSLSGHYFVIILSLFNWLHYFVIILIIVWLFALYCHYLIILII